MGGQESLRGYLLQTIICVLDAFNEDNDWNAVALEPNVDSEKVDIIWYYSDPARIIVDQVKSSKNRINIPQAKIWTKELEDSIKADEYNLILIGTFSYEMSKTEKLGKVMLKLKTLDIYGLLSETAHKLGIYLENKNLELIQSKVRETIIESLITRFEVFSTSGKKISKQKFDDVLFEKINLFLDNNKNQMLTDVKNYKTWKLNDDIQFPNNYIWEPRRVELKKEIINVILDVNDNRCIRIQGLPGIGKTRFIFECLNDDNFKNLIFYSNVDNFIESQAYDIIKKDNTSRLILILDNCSIEQHQKLINEMGNREEKTVITVGDTFSSVVEITKTINMQIFDPSYTNKIIKSIDSNIETNVIEKITHFSFGFPKLAVSVTRNYLENPEEFHKERFVISDAVFLKRLLVGDLVSNLDFLNRSKRVLTFLSLFSHIGFSGKYFDENINISEKMGIPMNFEPINDLYKPLRAEAEWIAMKAGVTWDEFLEVIDFQIARGFISKSNILNLRVSPIIHHLFNDWWYYYGENAYNFLESIPNKFKWKFTDNFFKGINFYLNFQDDLTYRIVINLFENIIENKKQEYFDRLIHIFIDRFYEFSEFERSEFLYSLLKNPRAALSFYTYLSIHKNIYTTDLEKIFSLILEKDNVAAEILTHIQHTYFLDHNKFNERFLLTVLENIKSKKLVKIIIKLIILNYKYINKKLKEFLHEVINEKTHIGTIALSSLTHFLSLENDIREKIINLLYENPEFFPFLLGIITLYYESIPKTISNEILINLSKSEDYIYLIYRFIINNDEKLDLNLRNEILNNISNQNSPNSLAIRQLLIENLKLSEEYINKLKFENADEKIAEIKSLINEKLTDELINTLSLLEYNSIFFKRLKLRFKPKEIRILILTEGLIPPNNENITYFYNSFSDLIDPLYYYIINAMFPHLKIDTSKYSRERALKKFAEEGFYLDDIFPMRYYDKNRDYLIKLWFEKKYLSDLQKMISKNTPIILIKENVFDLLYPILKDNGFNILNKEHIPYPDDKNHQVFTKRFKEVLDKI